VAQVSVPRVLVNVGYDSDEIKDAMLEDYYRFQGYLSQTGNVWLAILYIKQADAMPLIWMKRQLQRKDDR